MINSSLVSKLVNYLLLISLVVFLLFAGIFLYSTLKTPKGNLSVPLSRNMMLAHRVSDTEIWYYNGNTFVSINPKTQTTKYLSAYQMIPSVTQAFWLKSGVVFATQEVDNFSDLRAAADDANANLPDSQIGEIPTYWYLSFKTNKVRVLTTNVTQPENFGVIANDGSFVFKDSDFSYSVLHEDGEMFVGAVDMGEIESRPIYATKDSVTFITPGSGSSKKRVEMKKATFFKQDQQTLTNDVFEDGVGTVSSQISAIDETHFLISRAKKDNKVGSDLYIYDLKSGSKDRLVKQFDGTFTKTDDGVLAVQRGKSFNVVYRITKNGLVSKLRIGKDDSTYVSGAFSYKDGFILVNSNGVAQIASKNKELSRSIKTAAYSGSLEKEITNLPAGLVLDRVIESPYDTSYSLRFNGKAHDALNTIRSAITNKGYDPNQFIITLVPGRNADF